MSATVGVMNTPQLARTPSKKRKIEADTTLKSMKKRKHAEPSDEILPPSTTSSQPIATKEEKPKDKNKRKKEKAEDAVTLEGQEQHPADIELPDAPAIDTIAAESVQSEEPIRLDTTEEIDESLMKSKEPSCFSSKRISLYVPVPAISQTSSTASLLSLHLAPLLLTYFPPVEGIVLSFSDPILSAEPEAGINLPLRAPRSGGIPRNPSDETFARCADGFGVCWLWLTVTFLVFRPHAGDELKGWTNVQSEGFVGLVSYNYFQTAIGKERIPKDWIWDGPTRENAKKRRAPKKSKLRDEDEDTPTQNYIDSSQPNGIHDLEALEGGSGAFVDSDGNRVGEAQTFKVVDVEMVPGHEKDRWTLQIDGSLLSQEQEAVAVAEDKRRFEAQNRNRSRSQTPGLDDGEMPLMSGGLGLI